MTVEKEIPKDVLRFLEEFIDNIPQLEALLMLSESGGRSWLTSEVAARIYVTEARAEETLQALRRRRLLVSGGSPPAYRYAPATAGMRELVTEVGRSYQESLLRVTTLIHSKPSASVKEFARAFDLKKDR